MPVIPHDIAPSPVHGLGCFAASDIAIGDEITCGDSIVKVWSFPARATDASDHPADLRQAR